MLDSRFYQTNSNSERARSGKPRKTSVNEDGWDPTGSSFQLPKNVTEAW